MMVAFGSAVSIAVLKYKLPMWQKEATALELGLSAIPSSGLLVLCVKANRDEASLWVKFVSWVKESVFGDWQFDFVSPLVETWRLAFTTEALKLLALVRFRGGIILVVPGVCLLLIAALVLPAISLIVVAVTVAGSMLTTSAPWGFGQRWHVPWLIRTWIEDEPMMYSNGVRRNQDVLVSLRLSAPKSPSLMENKWNISTKDYFFRRFSFHHSIMCSDSSVIECVAEWILASLKQTQTTLNEN
jgi:hypothetical protein